MQNSSEATMNSGHLTHSSAEGSGDHVEKAPSFIRKWSSLVVMSLALAIIVIDTTLLNVSLSNIIHDLNSDIQSLEWVITAYALTLATLTVIGGRMGDLFGKKRMFMVGAVIFAIGSLIASFSNSFGMLLIGESLIEGIGAALMMPATSSLLLANFQGRDRAIAFGVWGGIAAGASAIGPILGGFLTSNYSWRWGFRINVVVTVLLLLGSMLIKKDPVTKEKPTLDWGGVFLSSIGLFLVVFGVIEASTYGWWTMIQPFNLFDISLNFGGLSVVPYSILLGLLILTAFVFWELNVEKKEKKPLVSMKLFQNKQFISGAMTTGIVTLGQAGLIFSIPVFLQSVKGLNAFDTGMSLLPMSLSLLVAAPLSAFLSKKITPKRLIQTGLVLDIIAMIILSQSFFVDADASIFAPGMIIYGIGMGLIMAQVNNLALSAVPLEEAGEASGVNNTIRQVGSSLGSAIIGSIMLTSLAANMTAGVEQNKDIPQQLKPYLEKTIATQTATIQFGGDPNILPIVHPDIKSDVHDVRQQAITDANKSSLSFAVIFVILGFIVSFQLPNKINLDRPKAMSSGH